ncbi:MAG: GAF domain-containing protein [Pseudomonadota bacterium]
MSASEHVAEPLSKREKEVAAAYADGQSYKEIARDLGVSPTTVRSHLRAVYSKLGVSSKIALAQFLSGESEGTEPQALGDASLTADLALELDEAVRRERSLAKVLRIISDQEGELGGVLDAVLDHALEICEAEFGVVFEYCGDLRFRELRARNIPPAFAGWLAEQGVFAVEPTTGLGRVATERQIINIADMRSEDIYQGGVSLRIATADLGKARSFATIPMMSGTRMIGAFVFYRTRVHPFNDRALELAQVFADQAAIAIENVRRFRQLQARLDREAANREILQAIKTSRDDEGPVFGAIARSAVELCNAQFCMLWRYDGTQVHYCASHGFTEAFMDEYLLDYPTAPEPNGIVFQVIQTSQTFHLPNAQTETYSDCEVARQHGYEYMLGVPIDTDDGMWGVMVLAWPVGQPPQDEQVELLETFAAQAVIAIENVRQFRALEARLDRERGTSEVLRLLSQSREDSTPVFDLILSKAAELCSADAAALTLGREGEPHQRLAAALDMHPETRALYERGRVGMNPDTSLVARAIVFGSPMKVADYADTDGYRQKDEVFRSLVDDTGMRTSLIVPLMSDGAGFGALILYRKTVAPYSADEISLVETFATQAVIAVENVEQFRALETLNARLGEQVEHQVAEIDRMQRLKRFMSPAVAEALVRSRDEDKLSSHRSLIATLFCDIRGFTAFCETAEPEETIEVLQTYHEEMSKLIAAHDAGVDKRMGDGIMVIFNDPFPCEDPAGNAVRLAIAMRDRMAELCKRWRRLGHRLGFGVGISFGYATIGMVGSEGRFDYTASGTSVNLAARLCDHAEDREILLSPRAYTAVEDDFRAESAGELSLKGIREPVEVFRLI